MIDLLDLSFDQRKLIISSPFVIRRVSIAAALWPPLRRYCLRHRPAVPAAQFGRLLDGFSIVVVLKGWRSAMPEPDTLAVLGTAALTQGINFLYGQATELLKRRRDRRDGPPKAAVLDGKLAADVDEKVVEERREQLRVLTEELQPFVTGARRVGEPPDAALIARVEVLRGILELAYRQRITLDGEDRAPTGTSIDAEVSAGRVDGELAVVDVDELQPGTRVKASGTVGDVGPGGKVTGFRGNVARG